METASRRPTEPASASVTRVSLVMTVTNAAARLPSKHPARGMGSAIKTRSRARATPVLAALTATRRPARPTGVEWHVRATEGAKRAHASALIAGPRQTAGPRRARICVRATENATPRQLVSASHGGRERTVPSASAPAVARGTESATPMGVRSLANALVVLRATRVTTSVLMDAPATESATRRKRARKARVCVLKGGQARTVRTRRVRWTAASSESASTGCASARRGSAALRAVARAERTGRRNRAQRSARAKPAGPGRCAIARLAKRVRTGRSAVVRIAGFALRESASACISFLEPPATTSPVPAPRLTSCAPVKASAMARLESASATTLIKTSDPDVSTRSARTTVQDMARAIPAQARAIVVHATIAPRHGRAETAARQRAKTPAITTASVCQARATATKVSPARRATSACAPTTARATACAP
jgi:hypothetical protein